MNSNINKKINVMTHMIGSTRVDDPNIISSYVRSIFSSYVRSRGVAASCEKNLMLYLQRKFAQHELELEHNCLVHSYTLQFLFE